MVAYAGQHSQTLRPRDTGAIFDGRVRIWLLTDDPLLAAHCGAKLHELGLPREMRLIQRPRVRGMMAVNPHVPPHWEPKLKANVPEFLRYAGAIMVLETEDMMDLSRFYNWLHAKNPNVPKQEGPKSLNQLANEGEIETIDAG